MRVAAQRPGKQVLLGMALALVGACGSTGPSGTTSPTSPTIMPTPSATSGPIRSTSPPPSGSVVVDPALLEHLPATVDGLPVQPTPESDAVVAADPAVVQSGEAVVTAIAIEPPTGEFAHATLIRLRPDVFDDDFFRSWRDSFDQGFCEQAGGVTGSAQAPMGEWVAYIGTCAGGAHTYHVWLGNSRVLVSVSSVGERRLGEQLVEALKD